MVYEEIDEHLQHLQHVTEDNSVVLGPGQIVVDLPLCPYCHKWPAACACGRPLWHLERSIEPEDAAPSEAQIRAYGWAVARKPG